jgi:hypothetical protein
VVLVNDLADAERVPGDVRALRRIAADNPHVLALLVVSAPAVLRMVAEAQAASAPWQVGFLRRWTRPARTAARCWPAQTRA